MEDLPIGCEAEAASASDGWHEEMLVRKRGGAKLGPELKIYGKNLAGTHVTGSARKTDTTRHSAVALETRG